MLKRSRSTPDFDFIGKRRVALFASSLLNLGVLLAIALVGFRWGVDFAGGTVMEVQFHQPVSAEQVRERTEKGGLKDVLVQRIGSEQAHTYVLQLGGTTQLTAEAAEHIRETLQAQGQAPASVRTDLASGLMTLRYAGPAPSREVLAEACATHGVGVREIRQQEANGGATELQVVAASMSERVQQALAAGLSAPDFET